MEHAYSFLLQHNNLQQQRWINIMPIKVIELQFLGVFHSLCRLRCFITHCVNAYCLTAAQILVIPPLLGWAVRVLVHVYNLCNHAIIFLRQSGYFKMWFWRNLSQCQRQFLSAIHKYAWFLQLHSLLKCFYKAHINHDCLSWFWQNHFYCLVLDLLQSPEMDELAMSWISCCRWWVWHACRWLRWM